MRSNTERGLWSILRISIASKSGIGPNNGSTSLTISDHEGTSIVVANSARIGVFYPDGCRMKPRVARFADRPAEVQTCRKKAARAD